MKVICISGKAQHGKDTVAEFILEELENKGYSILITHYGDLLKYICRTFFAWDGRKDERGREMLQKVGTDIIRTARPNYWVDFIGSLLNMFNGEWDYVIIPDCRFYNEIYGLKLYGLDITHVRVVRTNFESPLTIEQQNHPSETSLDNIEPDHYIHNDSTLDILREKSVHFINNYVKGE